MTADPQAPIAAQLGEAGPQAEVSRGVPVRAWVVVVSKAGQERRARRELEQQAEVFGEGFEVYLPMKLSMNRKRELVAQPFFPRYLFAKMDLRTSSWRRIWSTYGVSGMLGGSGERPYGVADWVIERLRAQEEAGYIRMGLEEDAAKGPVFGAGEAVRVAGGVLEGVFVERVDEKRAAILVSLLGRDSRVTVDLAKLRAAGC